MKPNEFITSTLADILAATPEALFTIAAELAEIWLAKGKTAPSLAAMLIILAAILAVLAACWLPKLPMPYELVLMAVERAARNAGFVETMEI